MAKPETSFGVAWNDLVNTCRRVTLEPMTVCVVFPAVSDTKRPYEARFGVRDHIVANATGPTPMHAVVALTERLSGT